MTYTTINELKDELILLERRRVLISQLIELYSPVSKLLPRPKQQLQAAAELVDGLEATGFESRRLRRAIGLGEKKALPGAAAA